MTTQEKAYNDYVKGLKYKELAEKYEVSVNTIKSWKRRYGWSREKGAHKKKKGAPFFNTNAVGNSGGGPAGNQKARTHGLYAKYVPEETLEIMDGERDKSTLDSLWESICLQKAAIVRAQRIMFVRDAADITKVQKRLKSGRGGKEVEFELQLPWDKQATFLKAQSRAMGTLNNMIKQYDEMCRQGLADEEQRLRIAKLKAEVAAMQDTENESVVIVDDVPDEG
jgi:uncharacterized protein YjcR